MRVEAGRPDELLMAEDFQMEDALMAIDVLI
jgi:hypothetical protein